MEQALKEPQEKSKAVELKASPAKGVSPFLWVIAGILVGIFLFWFFYQSMTYVSTDDASIQGHSVPIDPKVSLHVLKVLVEDNQKMLQGDVLVELDPEDFKVARQKAEADFESAAANEQEAQRDLTRYQLLVVRGEISRQQFDQTQLKAQTTHAQRLAAQAALKQAGLNLSYTKITAPISGYVTKKSVEEGQFVQVGQSLMSIVSPDMWVVANFKETDLTNMHKGQKVSISIDVYPGKTFAGHVDSIQRGTGSQFSLFPTENATGNFVKVVQRVPVKIMFDAPFDANGALALGMSVECKVKVR